MAVANSHPDFQPNIQKLVAEGYRSVEFAEGAALRLPMVGPNAYLVNEKDLTVKYVSQQDGAIRKADVSPDDVKKAISAPKPTHCPGLKW